ncbi:shikimate kinase [Sphingomonas sp. LY29]|uniref:shikimate kinase n=1 Tax=Sphingomonas sp. LY29 TaxID=3095341 RepID=UPI002D7A0FFB|nr:shikimate kinase [Sphingomonas sp. LY29]WRP26718.1 shikimate kinase [Sphingomonas sp. LY29]
MPYSFRPPLPTLDRPIVLVGLMGVGKSTVGRRLARRLKLRFVDSDTAIGEAAGVSAADLFERHGEPAFRDGERRIVARLAAEGPRVIATGGGAFADAETRAMLTEKTITVWLDAPVAVLAERTGRRDTRPLLRGGDREEVLASLAEQRSPLYAEAAIHVPSDLGSHAQVVEVIVGALADYLEARR